MTTLVLSIHVCITNIMTKQNSVKLCIYHLIVLYSYSYSICLYQCFFCKLIQKHTILVNSMIASVIFKTIV